MAMTTESAAARVLVRLRKSFGDESAGYAAGHAAALAVIPTGLAVLDNWILGCGGWPRGRIVELFGGEGSGKTSLAFLGLAQVQKAGGTAVLVETEYGFDADRARVFGVDPDALIICEPPCMEDALTRIEATLQEITPADGPCLVVWDSLAATPTRAECKEGLEGSAAMGSRARLMSYACRLLSGLASRSGATILVVNQVRDALGSFSGGTTTPGGRGLKHHASIRVEIMGGTAVKDGTTHVAKDVLVLTAKNKHAPPLHRARVRLRYDTGWDDIWTTVAFAKEAGVVASGARYDAATAETAALKLGWAVPVADPESAPEPLVDEPTPEAPPKRRKGKKDGQ